LPQVRDLFFDEFYAELERAVAGIERNEEEAIAPPVLGEEMRRRWRPYLPDPEDRTEALISVDGGVQVSNFAYGNFVAVGRACALINRPEGRTIEKRVKIYVEEVYDDRDRGFIPSYVRMIAEYEAARAAAERVLEEGGRPLVLLDGSLYFSRFPYAIREYQHHPELLAELFNSISALHVLGRDRGFPVAAVAKDSTVFYLYMELLKDAAARSGLGRLTQRIEEASSPLDLRLRMVGWTPEDREAFGHLVEARPLCDTALVRESVEEGGVHPAAAPRPLHLLRQGQRSSTLQADQADDRPGAGGDGDLRPAGLLRLPRRRRHLLEADAEGSPIPRRHLRRGTRLHGIMGEEEEEYVRGFGPGPERFGGGSEPPRLLVLQ